MAFVRNTGDSMTSTTSDNKKRQNKPHFGGDSMIDDGVFEKLHVITSSIDIINEGVANNFQPIIEFFSSNFASQLLQGWSYYAQVNNHQKFTDSTIKLTKALQILNKDINTLELGSALIRDLLSNYAKVVYRGLNNMKPSITNPILRLMKEIVSFNKGQHIDDFLTLFDLSLASLPRILSPTRTELADPELARKNSRLSMRGNFINFWLALICNAPPLLRRSILIDNHRIMSTWYKYMSKVDSIQLLSDTLGVLTNFVLKEKSFRKVTKCKVLNEAFISKIHNLYNSNEKELVTKVDTFFRVYATDPDSSVAFSDDKIWFKEPVYSSDASSSRNIGAMVVVNNKKFNLYNKLLFTMLTFFKPWEDDTQLNTVLKVLEHVPELVPPYCNHLASLGSHDARMTSYWFGMTLLLGRIINLPVPQKMLSIQTDLMPSADLVMEAIIPCTITKAALTKALQNEIALINQMGCQLLVFSFEKFKNILKLYDEKGWDSAKSGIINMFRARLPDLLTIVSALKDGYTKHHDNRILLASLTVILRHYSAAFPNFFNVTLPAPNVYREIMEEASLSGIDLVILDNFLQFQELNNSHTKWWHSVNGENSLFTLLIKLASSNNASNTVVKKVGSLLENLLRFTVTFNFDRLLVSPMISMISSLQNIVRSQDNEEPSQTLKVWKLLDETIARCIKTPYKYVDLSTEYGNISPFLLALSEQWAFVDKTTPFDLVLKWLLIFFRMTVFTGECSSGIQKLVKGLDFVTDEMMDVYLGFDNYERKLPEMMNEKYLLISNVDFSFFQYITLLPVNELRSISRYPVNELDAMGLIYRVQFLLDCDDLTLKDGQLSMVLDDLLSRAANYALSDESFASTFVSRDCFKIVILDQNIDLQNEVKWQKYAYVTNDMIQIYEQLDTDITEFRTFMFSLFLECYTSWSVNSKLSSVLGNALHMFNADQLIEVLSGGFIKDDKTIIEILMELYQKNQSLDSRLFCELLGKNSEEVAVILAKFVDTGFQERFDINEVITTIIGHPSNIAVLEQILIRGIANVEVLPFLNKIEDDSLTMLFCSYLQHSDQDQFLPFLQKAVNLGLEKVESSTGSEFKLIMNMFHNCHHLLTDDQKSDILEMITTRYEHKYIPEIARFIELFPSVNNDLIRVWMSKSALFITKVFSERNTLSISFLTFLGQFRRILLKNNVWTLVASSILNTQIEAIVASRWICDENVVEYLNALVLSSSKKQTDSSRMLQILINNENICFVKETSGAHLRFLTASLIYSIFHLDIDRNSTYIIQEKLLSFYCGTISPEDKLFLNLLDDIESKTSVPWTNNIISWDFLDEMNDGESDPVNSSKIVVKEKEGMVVVLSKILIEQTVSHYCSDLPEVPILDRNRADWTWQQLLNFNNAIKLATDDISISNYDPKFILLLIIHNDELLKQSQDENGTLSYKFDMKKIVETGILQFIIMSLSDPGEISQIALDLIQKMMHSLEEDNQYRDGNIVKILLTKIAYTFQRADENGIRQTVSDVSPITWRVVSRLAGYLRQPTSFMYENAYRWVLSFPCIRNNEIPMLNSIMSLKSSEDNENYYKNLHWILESIEQGLRTKQDVQLLKSKNLLEWLMNILNSPYLAFKLQSVIDSIIYKIQRIETGGSTLITRYAGVSFLECYQQGVVHKSDNISSDLSVNVKNKMRLKEILSLKQTDLNCEELAVGYSTIISSQKRLMDWMGHDTGNSIKRICHK